MEKNLKKYDRVLLKDTSFVGLVLHKGKEYSIVDFGAGGATLSNDELEYYPDE